MLMVLGFAGVAVASRADDVEVERHDVVVEVCRDTHAAPKVAAPNTQTIAVTVPRTAFLKVNDRGRITWAATNTGCAPRMGDDVYVIDPSGRYALTKGMRLDRIEWKGDFSRAAVFQRQ